MAKKIKIAKKRTSNRLLRRVQNAFKDSGTSLTEQSKNLGVNESYLRKVLKNEKTGTQAEMWKNVVIKLSKGHSLNELTLPTRNGSTTE